MSWFKWPLLFSAVYGLLWMRQHVFGQKKIESVDVGQAPRLGSPEGENSEDLLRQSRTEDPRSSATLSYAFQKLSKTDREVSSLPEEDPMASPINLEAVLMLKDRPQELLLECEKQLSTLSRNDLPERVILLREVISARNSETMYQVEEILEAERLWLSQESSFISDLDALKGYIGELTRLSLMADAGKGTPLLMIQELSDAVRNNPQAHQSLRQAVKNYIPWEYKNWSRDLPDELEDKEKSP